MEKTYVRGQHLQLTLKDRMEDPTDWQIGVFVDMETITETQLESYFEGSFLIAVNEVEEDYTQNPMSAVQKIYK